MEDACKALDFNCAVADSGAGLSESDSRNLNRLSNLKLELTSQQRYSHLLSEMLTYSVLTLGSEDIDALSASLREEIAATQKHVKSLVIIINLNTN